MNIEQSKPDDQFSVPLTEATSDFSKHISDTKNSRIMLSGAFGSGKTYFLDKFFKGNKLYEVIYIRPINYSVSTNEDIFELVKYDILFHLLSIGLSFEKINFNSLTQIEWYVHDRPIQFLKGLLNIANKLGQTLPFDIFEVFKKISIDLKDYNKSIETDDLETVIKYLKSQSSQKGSIYEQDGITILIQNLVNQIKDGGRQAVLIIDDLDRIDPDHIFRLLNIFGSHHDLRKDENKFSFNKMIVVCDINNIRQIFHSKYGMGVDFSGYIDKFYSKDVFYFDNSRELSKHIRSVLKTISVQGEDQSEFIQFIYSFKESNYFLSSASFVLTNMVMAKVVNTRKI